MGSDRSFTFRGRRVPYQGPFPSNRPHLKRTIILKMDAPPTGVGFVSWLLAEPESLHLHLGLAGRRLRAYGNAIALKSRRSS